MIRKWIYKLRYILIILSALLWILGLSNSFWYEIIQNCYSNNWYSNNQCWDITDEFFQYRNWYNKIDTNFNFIYQSTDDYNVFYLQEDWIFLYWWEDHKLHYKWDQFSWLIWNVCVVWSDNINDIWSRCGYAVGWENINWCWANYNEDNSIFYNTNWNFDKVYFLPWYIDWLYNNWWGWVICWVKWKGAVCFALNQIWSAWLTCWFLTWYSQDINIKDYWLSELSSYFWSSPFNGAWGGWNISLNLSSDDLLRYFRERYGWSDSMCYVWTNTTAIWWDNVSFDYWTWATIFELFNSIYWAWNWTQYIVNVWTWINSWLLNYNYWFNWSNNCYNYYSWWQVVSDCSYTRFPFAWQKTAVYFMADLLNSRGVSDDWNLGYEFAVFCDNVFNWSDSAPIKEGSALQSNSSSYITYQNLYYWTSSVINSWDQLSEIFWTWNWYNDWNTSSWVVDLDSFFNKFNWFIDDFSSYFIKSDYQSTRAILPDYIIVAFCLILLFGIIRK